MQRLHIKLQPSKQFLCLWALAWMASLGIIFFLNVTMTIKIALASVVFFYGIAYFFKSSTVNEIIFQHGHASQLIHSNRQKLKGHLRGDSTVTRWVSVLRFTVVDRRWPMSVVVFQDALSPDQYRQLLKYCRSTSS